MTSRFPSCCESQSPVFLEERAFKTCGALPAGVPGGTSISNCFSHVCTRFASADSPPWRWPSAVPLPHISSSNGSRYSTTDDCQRCLHHFGVGHHALLSTFLPSCAIGCVDRMAVLRMVRMPDSTGARQMAAASEEPGGAGRRHQERTTARRSRWIPQGRLMASEREPCSCDLVA